MRFARRNSLKWLSFWWVFCISIVPAYGFEYIRIIDSNSPQRNDSLASFVKGKSRYVDIEMIAKVAGGSSEEDNQNDKLRINLPLGELLITNGTPFVLSPRGVNQLVLPIERIDGKWCGEVGSLFDLFGKYSTGSFKYDDMKRIISFKQSEFDITGFRMIHETDRLSVEIPLRKVIECHWERASTGVVVRFVKASIDTLRWKFCAVGQNFNTDVSVNSKETRVVFSPTNGFIFDKVDVQREPSSVVVRFTKSNSNNTIKSDSSVLKKLQFEKERWAMDMVVIDPGHGGKDPGAVGPGKLKEKDVTLDVALRLAKELEKNGIKTKLTRDKDVFVPLAERTRIANNSKGKLFVSLHCNASTNSKAVGMETYFLAPAKSERAMKVALLENEVIRYEDATNEYRDLTEENYILLTMAQSIFTKESQDLAALIQERVSPRIQMKNRGVDQAGFYVLIGASMPSVLFEIGFISNKEEEKRLKDSKFRQKLANELCAVILDFLKSK